MSIQWMPRARRSLNRLDLPTRTRIVAAIQKFDETGQGDVIKLTDKNPPEYRLRVGGWRVRFAWEQASDILIVLYVFKRGQGYE